MDRKLFSRRILKNCVAGSLLVLAACYLCLPPAGSFLPLRGNFKGTVKPPDISCWKVASAGTTLEVTALKNKGRNTNISFLALSKDSTRKLQYGQGFPRAVPAGCPKQSAEAKPLRRSCGWFKVLPDTLEQSSAAQDRLYTSEAVQECIKSRKTLSLGGRCWQKMWQGAKAQITGPSCFLRQERPSRKWCHFDISFRFYIKSHNIWSLFWVTFCYSLCSRKPFIIIIISKDSFHLSEESSFIMSLEECILHSFCIVWGIRGSWAAAKRRAMSPPTHRWDGLLLLLSSITVGSHVLRCSHLALFLVNPWRKAVVRMQTES